MCKRGHADHIYVCTRTPCTFVQFSLMHQETALFSRGAATLLRGGLEEGGVHTDWATDWVQGSHSYRDTRHAHTTEGHVPPPHLHHRYLCPLPPPLLLSLNCGAHLSVVQLFSSWMSVLEQSGEGTEWELPQ